MAMIEGFSPRLKSRVVHTLLVITLSQCSAAYARLLECQISGLETISVTMNEKLLSVKQHQKATSWRSDGGLTEREVIFHHYSDPMNLKTKLSWEPPHSLVLLKSIAKDGVEFAPDLLFVNWGKGTLKTISTYEDKAETRWTCLRKD